MTPRTRARKTRKKPDRRSRPKKMKTPRRAATRAKPRAVTQAKARAATRAKARTVTHAKARAATRAKAPRPTTPRASTAPPPAPNAIGCTFQHLDFTSHAMDEVKRFYTETLGFSKFSFDSQFNYLRVVTAPGASLGFMPPMPGPPEQWRPPREPALYLIVENVDRVWRELAAKGVPFQQEPTNMPWMHRVAILKDPEGRTVMLAQALQR